MKKFCRERLNKILNFNKESLIGGAAVYTVANVINNAIPFLLMPVLTRLLTPEDYGYTAMFGVLSSIAAALVGLSVHGSLARYYFEQKEVIFGKYVGSCCTLLAISTVVLSLLSFPLAGFISNISSFPVQWLPAVVISAFFQFIILLRLTIWQLEKKAMAYGAMQILNTVLTLAATIFLIKIFGFNWQGRIIGLIVVQLFTALYSLISLHKDSYLQLNLNKDYIKRALRFGLPLIPHSIGGIVIVMTDRILLSNMVGLKETGLYAVGAQIGMIINILAESFNKAYSPWLFEKLNQRDMEVQLRIVRGTYLYFVLILLGSILFGLLSPYFFSLFLGPKFIEANQLIFWLALGGALNGMYFMVTNYIFYSQKTGYLAVATALSGILNAVVSFALIRKNGIMGAAQGTFISLFFSFVLTWYLSFKSYPMPWFDKRVFALFRVKNES